MKKIIEDFLLRGIFGNYSLKTFIKNIKEQVDIYIVNTKKLLNNGVFSTSLVTIKA